MKIFELKTPEETTEFGIKLGKILKEKDIICLTGDLGAGKTHLTKGIAIGLEIEEDITSPTFTIVHEYAGRLPLYHFDVYRICDSSEMYEIGFDDYLFGNGVSIIEWANLVEDLIPEEAIQIELKYKEVGRELIMSGLGKRFEEIVEEVSK